jgi:hypothetical protein
MCQDGIIMAVDSSNNIAGNYPTCGPVIPCILDEGAPTVTATGTVFNMANVTSKVLTWATPLARGNWVAISDNVACTWAATGGIPVVERAANGDTCVIGKIQSTPEEPEPPANTAAGATLADRLAAGIYRTAIVEIYGGITCLQKAEVYLDGTNGFTVGQCAKLKHNMVGDYADDNTAEVQLVTTGSGGVGIVAFHYGADGDEGDILNCLVGINAPMISLTGA